MRFQPHAAAIYIAGYDADGDGGIVCDFRQPAGGDESDRRPSRAEAGGDGR